MSIVSSYFSVRSTALGINPQFASFMDSVFAIGFGLGVRFVIDAVSHHDQRVTGTLVGLWEGVVLQHFLRKMPTSSDPYVAYAVRLFIDFLFTESLARLVLVLVWTGMGVILADIAPALWIDAGLRRIWRRFRRDLYVMSRSISSVSYPRTRTVRFSPSQTASVISSVPPSVFTTNTQDPTLLSMPTPVLRQRHVPGAYPSDVDVSETETDIGSVLGLRDVLSESSAAPRTTRRRFSSRTRHEHDFETETDITSDMNDVDEENLSSSESSTSTETADPSAMNPSEIPDYDEEEQVVTLEKKPEDSDRELTPKQNNITMLPTPSDSFAIHHHDEPDGLQPPHEVPIMPDEDINQREATSTQLASKALPPTPPAKDNPPFFGISSDSPPPQHVPPPTDVPQTALTQKPSHEAGTSHSNDALIDFTDPSPTSSHPPPRFSEAFPDGFNYPQSRSPPPTYGQGDPRWNDSAATIIPAGNHATNNSNADPNERKNGTASTNKGIAVAPVDTEQPQGEDKNVQGQADSSTSLQTPSGASHNGNAKETHGNDSNEASKNDQVQGGSPTSPLGASDKGKAKETHGNDSNEASKNDQVQSGSSTFPLGASDKGKAKETHGNGSNEASKNEQGGSSTSPLDASDKGKAKGTHGNDSNEASKNDQVQGGSSTPQTFSGASGKGKAKETDNNGSNGTAKMQAASSTSLQTRSVASDKGKAKEKNDNSSELGVQPDNAAQSTSAAQGKQVDKSVNVVNADNNVPGTGSEAQPDQQGQSTTAAQRPSIPGNESTPDDKTAKGTGDGSEQQVASARDKLPSGHSGEADQGAEATHTQAGDSHATARDAGLDNVDEIHNADANKANASGERSSEDKQMEAGPSTLSKQNVRFPPTGEESDPPKTSSERLIEALKLRKEVIALDNEIASLPKSAAKRANNDAAKQKETLVEKIARRLDGGYSKYLTLYTYCIDDPSIARSSSIETSFELSEDTPERMVAVVEGALAQLLLEDQPQCTVTLASKNKPLLKNQKAVLYDLLTTLVLEYLMHILFLTIDL
jgi:hypothetical protein